MEFLSQSGFIPSLLDSGNGEYVLSDTENSTESPLKQLTPLLKSICENKLKLIKLLIIAKVSIPSNLLIFSVIQNKPDVLDLLIQMGFDPNVKLSTGEYLLDFLLQSYILGIGGHDLFTKNMNKQTLIHILLKHGVKPSFKQDIYPICHHEIRRCIVEIYEILYEKIKIASSSNKKLVLMLGESHNSKKCLLLESLFLYVAFHFGFRNHLLECDEEGLVLKQKGLGNEGLNADNSFKFITDFLTSFQVVRLSTTLGMNQIPIDTIEPSAQEIREGRDISVRDENMSRIIHNRVSEHSVLIIGSGHMLGLYHLLNQSFHVVPVNITPFEYDRSSAKRNDREAFILTETVRKFVVHGNAQLYSKEVIQELVDAVNKDFQIYLIKMSKIVEIITQYCLVENSNPSDVEKTGTFLNNFFLNMWSLSDDFSECPSVVRPEPIHWSYRKNCTCITTSCNSTRQAMKKP